MEYVKTFFLLAVFIFLSFGCIVNIIRGRDERKEKRRQAKEAKKAEKLEKKRRKERKAMLKQRLKNGEPLDDDEYEKYIANKQAENDDEAAE